MIIHIILSENDRLLSLGKLQILPRCDENSSARALRLLHKVAQAHKHKVGLIQLLQKNFEFLCREIVAVVDHHTVLRRKVDIKSATVVDQWVYK